MFARVRGLFGRKRLEAELDDEVRFHVEMQIDDNIARGMSPDEARYAALRSFGAVEPMKEKYRDRRAFTMIETTVNDMRYALRTLRRSPGYAGACVVTLALGIGASTAIFSLFDQLLLRKLPVPEPDRLVMVDWRGSKVGWNWGGGNLMSYPFCRDVQAQDRFFDGVLCRHPTESYVSSGGRAEMERIEIVSGSYFDALAVRPEVGRLLAKSDDVTPGANPVVAISYNYWKNRLGGSPDVMGRKLLLNNFPMTVVGVAPASFRGVDPARDPILWVGSPHDEWTGQSRNDSVAQPPRSLAPHLRQAQVRHQRGSGPRGTATLVSLDARRRSSRTRLPACHRRAAQTLSGFDP
jgi:hypothetical protein